MSRGQSIGPQGVQLALKKADGGDHVVKQTVTSSGGDFVFEKVLPGDFIIEASRPPWIFDVVCRIPLVFAIAGHITMLLNLCPSGTFATLSKTDIFILFRGFVAQSFSCCFSKVFDRIPT